MNAGPARGGKPPVRVAFLQAELGVGGAERLVEGLIRRMDPARVRGMLATLHAPGPLGERLASDGFAVLGGLAHSRFDPSAGHRLARALRAHAVDVVYVTDSAMPMFWAGLLRRFSPRPRVVLGYHTTGRPGASLRDVLARAAAIGAVDRLVALADSHRSFLAGSLGLPESRFDVICSGVDLGRFGVTQPKAEARRRAGLPADVPLAGIVAALRPEKHHALFLRAARRVLESVPEARFVIAGDGPERGGVERERDRLGLGERVLMLGTRHDVPDLYRALDVAVLSSHPVVETLPVTLIEAAASGVAAVATDVGSVRDVVADGETGYIVPPSDEAALAGRMRELLADATLRERFGREARARAERRFDERDMLRRYEDLFASLAAGAR
jgi:glycosyltransferase involved in cell wall biosynthesis